MPDNLPSRTALVTSAAFTGGNLAVLVGGFLASMVVGILLGYLGVAALLMLGAGGMYVAGVLRTASDPGFARRIAAEDASLPPLPGRYGTAQRALPGGTLSGKYLEEYRRVETLKNGLVSEIKALPPGPGREAFEEFVPRLDEVTREVHQLVGRMAKVEKDLGAGVVQSLETEASGIEAKLAATTDPEAKSQLQTALAKKREAITHYQRAGEGVSRIGAQVEAIASGLQEAKARVAALRSNPDQGVALTPARQAVEGISREVKYLAEAVEETTKLLM